MIVFVEGFSVYGLGLAVIVVLEGNCWSLEQSFRSRLAGPQKYAQTNGQLGSLQLF